MHWANAHLSISTQHNNAPSRDPSTRASIGDTPTLPTLEAQPHLHSMHLGEQSSANPLLFINTPTMTPMSSTLTFPVADSTPTPSSSGSTLTTPQSATFPLDHLPDHPHPCVPSTFLPSYYPDSRDRLPLLPSQQHQQNAGNISRAGPHSAADVDRISASGPSTRHLLDGVALASSPLRPSGPTMTTPTYDLSPTAYTGGLPQQINTWVPKRRGEWNDLPFGEFGQGSGGSASHRSYNTITSTLSAPVQSPLIPPQPSLASFSPNIAATQSSSSSPALPGLRIDPPGGSQAQTPYPQSAHMGPSRSYPGSTAMSNPPQTNAAFPQLMFGNATLADTSSTPITWNRDESKVSGEDYARALGIYEQLQSAIPQIRPISQSAPISQGQEFDKLLRLAQDGILAVTGQQVLDPVTRLVNPPSSSGSQSTGASNKRMHAGKGKPPTKCLGCGATETPEWRRGPMGPRTLCNACGLVHVKLQRKKKKLEEKAAAAAAAAAKKG